MRFFLLVLYGWVMSYPAYPQYGVGQVAVDQYVFTADSLSRHGAYKASNYWYQKAQDWYRKYEQWAPYMGCANGIGYNLGKLNQLDDAAEAVQHALLISEANLGHEHPEVARSYYVSGLLHLYRGEYETARTYGQRALHLQRHHRGESRLPMSDSYELLGMADIRIGHYDRARMYHQRALTIRKEEQKNSSSRLADSYHHIGLTHQYKGAHNQALAYFRQALTLRRKRLGEQHPDVAESYNNLGTVYGNQEEYDQAHRYHQRALKIRKEQLGELHPSVALSYNSLGAMCHKQKQYDQALEYYQRALAVRRASLGEHHPDVAISYNSAGNVYRDQERYDQALDYHQRALAIIKGQLGNVHPRTAISLTRIGRVYHQQRAYAAALSAYRQAMLANGVTVADTSAGALPALEQYLDGRQLLFTLEAQATTLFAMGRYEQTYHTYLLTDSLLTRLGRSRLTRRDKVSLAKTAKRLRERAIHTALILHRATRQEQYLQAAFYYSERSKAGVLTEALSALEANRFGQVPDSLLQQEDSLKARRSFYRSQLIGPDSVAYRNKLFALNRQHDSLVQVLELQHSDYYQLKYATRTATIPLIQSGLRSKEMLISYFMGDSTRCAFVVTHRDFAVVPLPPDSSLDTRLVALQQALRSGSATYADYQRPAHALYQRLLAPILEDPRWQPMDKLTIVPDGTLGFLPFELLLTTLPTGKTRYADLPYLLRDYAVHYGYSATWLFHPFGQSDRAATEQYIAFAPSYSGEAPAEASTRYHELLTPLRFNRREANNIKQYLSGVAYLDQAAVEKRFKQEAHRYRVIHLAMHALADDQQPMNSQLVFSQHSTDSLEDNRLHAYELYDMKLSADLAVLSACETGYGKLEQGEGIMSLARAFAYAGCPSIVMSHWLVDDAASAELMDVFYNYLSDGMPKDEALQQAKLAYLASATAQRAHPFFWSNFVLVGDATPLANMANDGKWLYVGGGVLMLLVVAGAFYFYKQRPPVTVLSSNV